MWKWDKNIWPGPMPKSWYPSKFEPPIETIAIQYSKNTISNQYKYYHQHQKSQLAKIM